ncbi:uncharacterized protein [Panulirus ornatus]|uniref:uncharacterized protein n=1 Tax=Panulirus ornatus TaxID=150431 RepID=UPI003A862F24
MGDASPGGVRLACRGFDMVSTTTTPTTTPTTTHMLGPPVQTASIRRGGIRRHLLTTLQPLRLPPAASPGDPEASSSPLGRRPYGHRVSPGPTAKAQHSQTTSPSSAGVFKVARNVSSWQRVSSSAQPPPKPPRKAQANPNAAYTRSSRSPPGGVKTTNANGNVKGASHGSPAQTHPVVNVNERRSSPKTSPNGNRSFVVKTSPNGNSGVPAFASDDNSSLRRLSTKNVSPSHDKPPKPTRRSSLKEQRPADCSQKNNNNLARSPGERTSCGGVDDSYSQYPHFNHLLPSKSKIRQKSPALPQGVIDTSRHESSVTFPRIAPEGNANGCATHHSSSSSSSNGSTVCCRGLGSGRKESFPQFPGGRREIENGEGNASTLPNVPNDPREATVTLNVSDTIRRRVPRRSLNLEEENFVKKLKKEVDLDLIEGRRSPCPQSRFTLAVVDDPAGVVLEVVTSKSIRLQRVNSSQAAPRSNSGAGNKPSVGKRVLIREEHPIGRTSLSHNPKKEVEALPQFINNSRRRVVSSTMGNKQQKGWAEENAKEPTPVPSARPLPHPTTPSNTKRKLRNNGVCVGGDNAGPHGEANDARNKSSRDKSNQKTPRRESTITTTATRSPARTTFDPGEEYNPGGTRTPATAADNRDRSPALKRRPENEQEARGDPAYQAASALEAPKPLLAASAAVEACSGVDNRGYESGAWGGSGGTAHPPSCTTPRPQDGAKGSDCGGVISRAEVREELTTAQAELCTPSAGCCGTESHRKCRRKRWSGGDAECEASGNKDVVKKAVVDREGEVVGLEPVCECEEIIDELSSETVSLRLPGSEEEEGLSAGRNEKRRSLDRISELYCEEDSFCTSFLEEEFSQDILKIYTDWANHYLDKSRSRRHIHDLQADVTDGVILAEVIEAVTGQKVPDINKKPKNSTQMLENISASLAYLAALGVALDGLTAKDIKDGNLKAILSLFFALSR